MPAAPPPAGHKGYGVPEHVEAIRRHGPCPQHRRTFAPTKHWYPLVQLEEGEEEELAAKVQQKQQEMNTAKGKRGGAAGKKAAAARVG